MLRPILRVSFLVVMAGLALAPTSRAIDLSGNLSDSTTGPIPAGVHRVVGSITVPSGATLTIQPGAILKFNGGLNLRVAGTLAANGTAGQRIYFTSFSDDTVGGDTNGDGNATSPGPGQWLGIILPSTCTATTLNECEVRYTGTGGWSSIYVEGAGAQATITNSSFRDGSQNGIDGDNHPTDLTVANCSFIGNAGAAVTDVLLDDCPGFTNNTATGNGENYIKVTNASPTANVTLTEANCMNGALVFASTCTIPGGSALTLQAGTILKLVPGTTVRALGSLITHGTVAKPVVITTLADDDFGGDTNGDGPSNGAPGSILGCVLGAGSTGNSLDHTIVRYSGWGGWSGLYIEGAGAQATVTNCSFRDGSQNGIDGDNHPIDLVVSNCSFTGNSQYAVTDVRIDDCVDFTNNTATGNGGNFIRLTQASPSGNVTLTEANCVNGAVVLAASCTIPMGVTLTLQAGVVLKLANGLGVRSVGTLVANGTAAKPVVITALADDDFGGDTNGDGPSNGAPGSILGWQVAGGSTGNSLDHTFVRYSGWGGWSGLYVEGSGAQATITSCSFQNGSQNGIDANNHATDLIVTDCSFTGNAGYAVTDVRIDDVPDFTNNEASGNGGNYINVTLATPSSNVTIAPDNCLEGALVFASSSNVGIGTSLTLEAGVVVKFIGGNTLAATDGAIHLNGVAGNPVVLTAFADDASGGDTNGDGSATSPGPGSWQGVRFDPSAAASTIEHVIIRYPGWGGWYGLRSQSPLLDARAVRIERAASYGFSITALAYGADWVAWNGLYEGIRLESGTFVLERCTAANNAVAGIIDSGPFNGVLRSSIAFGNGSGNIVGFASGEVLYSNGSPTLAGTNGNIDADPKFVDAANGDLRLQLGSPCIETGDPLGYTAAILDQSGVTRSLDGDFDKNPRVDMGAYEFSHVRLEVTGTFQVGGTITFTSTGTPGLISYLFLSTAQGSLLFYPYGTLLVDPLSSFVFVPWPGPPANPSFVVPAFLPTPQPIVVQQIVFQGSTAGGGNLSNVEKFVIE